MVCSEENRNNDPSNCKTSGSYNATEQKTPEGVITVYC
jgi:hypothetical protein